MCTKYIWKSSCMNNSNKSSWCTLSQICCCSPKNGWHVCCKWIWLYVRIARWCFPAALQNQTSLKITGRPAAVKLRLSTAGLSWRVSLNPQPVQPWRGRATAAWDHTLLWANKKTTRLRWKCAKGIGIISIGQFRPLGRAKDDWGVTLQMCLINWILTACKL